LIGVRLRGVDFMPSAARRAFCLAGLLLCVGAASGVITTLSAGSNERVTAGRVKSGTGFFVSRDGFLVTSAHVVSGCRNLSVWRPDGTQRPSYVVAFDRRRDVALLWADGMTGGIEPTVAGMAPRPGAEVYTLGYGVVASRPLSPALVEGWLIGDRVARPGNRVVVFRGSLHAGHSGGAVLTSDGSLIGMVVGRDDEYPEIGVAIPKEDIEALLSPYGVQLPRRATTPNARDVLEAISVLIQCSNDGGPVSLRKSVFAGDHGFTQSGQAAHSAAASRNPSRSGSLGISPAALPGFSVSSISAIGSSSPAKRIGQAMAFPNLTCCEASDVAEAVNEAPLGPPRRFRPSVSPVRASELHKKE
jgi:hypothetical protein